MVEVLLASIAFVGGVVLSVAVERLLSDSILAFGSRYGWVFHSTHRLVAPEDFRPHRLGLGEPRSLFERSWDVYAQNRWNVDARDEVSGWLMEDALRDSTEEIYLISRRGRSVDGVVYASLYKVPSNRCFVNALVIDQKLHGIDSCSVGTKLWHALVTEVGRTGNKMAADPDEFFFETSRPDGQTESREAEFRRRSLLAVLQSIGAEVVAIPHVAPDTDDQDEKNELPGMLLYTCPDRPRRSLRLKSVLQFVYGTHYLWTFEYGEDAIDVDAVAKRVRYHRAVSSRIAARYTNLPTTIRGTDPTYVPLLPIGSPEAKANPFFADPGDPCPKVQA